MISRFLPDGPGFSLTNFATELLVPLPKDPQWPHFEYDEVLGWAPTPNRPKDPKTDSMGIRSNGPETLERKQDNGILIVGNSFAYGHGVGDSETLAAFLERKSGIPVSNGAVEGYGIDQAYLLARRLVPTLRPSVLIFGYIPENIRRT